MADVKVLSDAVLDAACAVIAACDEARVVASDDTELIAGIALTAGNFTDSADYASGGRQCTCLVSDTSDMKAISVTVTGAAKKIEILKSSVVQVTATLSSAVSIASTDQVNLGTFVVVFPDPT